MNKPIILSMLSISLLTFSETYAGHDKHDIDQVTSTARRSSGGELEPSSHEIAASAGKKQEKASPWEDLPLYLKCRVAQCLDPQTTISLAQTNKEGYTCVEANERVEVQHFLQAGSKGMDTEGAPGSFSVLARLLSLSAEKHTMFSRNVERTLLENIIIKAAYKETVTKHFAEFDKLAVVSRTNRVLYSYLQTMAKAHSQKDCSIEEKHRLKEVFIYDLLEGEHPGAFMAGMQHYFGTNWRIFGTDAQIQALKDTLAAKIDDLHRFIQGQYVTLDDVADHSASTKNRYLVVRQDKLAHRLGQVREYFAQPANTKKTLLVDITQADSTLSLNNGHMKHFKSLAFVNTNQNVTSIGDDFLMECTGLTELDLTPLSNVTAIGDDFLGDCIGLTELDLTPLSNVTAIGDDFLGDCIGLTALDLAPLSNITSVGYNFLKRCTSITALDLTPLSNVTSVESGFLMECTGLTELDLTPLSNITSVEDGFLYRCAGLTELDLNPLSNITSVGDSFLEGCTGLTELDLNPLSNITSVESGFLMECTGLTELDLNPLSNITSVGNDFLYGCTGLTELDLNPLSNITSVGHNFLKDNFCRMVWPQPLYKLIHNIN